MEIVTEPGAERTEPARRPPPPSEAAAALRLEEVAVARTHLAIADARARHPSVHNCESVMAAGILAVAHFLAAMNVEPPAEYEREQPGTGPVPATVLGWPVGGREVAS